MRAPGEVSPPRPFVGVCLFCFFVKKKEKRRKKITREGSSPFHPDPPSIGALIKRVTVSAFSRLSRTHTKDDATCHGKKLFFLLFLLLSNGVRSLLSGPVRDSHASVEGTRSIPGSYARRGREVYARGPRRQITSPRTFPAKVSVRPTFDFTLN